MIKLKTLFTVMNCLPYLMVILDYVTTRIGLRLGAHETNWFSKRFGVLFSTVTSLAALTVFPTLTFIAFNWSKNGYTQFFHWGLTIVAVGCLFSTFLRGRTVYHNYSVLSRFHNYLERQNGGENIKNECT